MLIVPRLSGVQLIETLTTAGFVVAHIKGSHHRLQHPDDRTTTVPIHGHEIIGSGPFAEDTTRL